MFSWLNHLYSVSTPKSFDFQLIFCECNLKRPVPAETESKKVRIRVIISKKIVFKPQDCRHLEYRSKETDWIKYSNQAILGE